MTKLRQLRRLCTTDRGFEAKLAALTRYEAAADAKLRKTVARILADVRSHGDAALLRYARRFDKTTARSVAELEIKPRIDASGPQLEALRAARLERRRDDALPRHFPQERPHRPFDGIEMRAIG